MDGWWKEIEDEILVCLGRHGELSPSDLGRQLGLSESATASLLAILIAEGKVRMASVTAASSLDWAAVQRTLPTAISGHPTRSRKAS